jgi:hypothetical protein
VHIVWLVVYGLFALIAGLNLFLMRRPKPEVGTGDSPSLVFLIPARNEAENLKRLLPTLKGKVYVFDDESDDGTAEVARSLGATVVSPRETLPAGWTGKNRACHELAKAVTEDTNADWLVFLDADVHPKPDFAEGVRSLAKEVGSRCGVITGFPDMIPGQGIQPLFLGWVGWVLLASNPYGLVSVTKAGHNRFTNGQFHAWRKDVYTRLWPNEAVRSAILEDVKMGRLCAKQGVPVEVANVSSILAVKMYDTWKETFDGMSKNSHEITDSVVGSLMLSALLLLVAWGWLLAGPYKVWCLGLFVLSGVFCALIVKAKPWGMLLLPFVISIGSVTIMRSLVWHRRGMVVWKGRTYPASHK